MKHIRTTTFIIIILLLCTHVSFAQGDNNFKVKLSVSSHEKGGDIIPTVESYISRELRSLGDVTIVETEEDCKLEVIAIEGEALSGIKTGIAISVVYYEPQNIVGLLYIQEEVYNLISLLESYPATEQQQELIEKVSALSYRIGGVYSEIGNYSALRHLFYLGAVNNLRNRCEKIVVDFDNLYLKEKRKTIAEIKAKLRGEEAPETVKESR